MTPVGLALMAVDLGVELYAFKRYQDHRRYLDLERRFVAEALAAATPRG